MNIAKRSKYVIQGCSVLVGDINTLDSNRPDMTVNA